eukprot:248631_1
MGYGSRALYLLTRFYQGDLLDLAEIPSTQTAMDVVSDPEIPTTQGSKLTKEQLRPRKNLSPLLEALHEKKPEPLHWVGVSFGLTKKLLNFWGRRKFKPMYLRQTTNSTTGEHTYITLKTLSGAQTDRAAANDHWLDAYASDFRARFRSLLAVAFRSFEAELALRVLDPPQALFTSRNVVQTDGKSSVAVLTTSELAIHLSEYDLRLLESYASNLIDYHTIIDLVPAVARLLFAGRVSPVVRLSGAQCAILLGVGVQMRGVGDLQIDPNAISPTVN